MGPSNKLVLRRLSFDFVRDIYPDGTRRCIIPGKWLLESLFIWPGTDNTYIETINWLIFINLLVTEIFHASYVITASGDIGDAIVASATVITTFEGLYRFYVVFKHKEVLNDILYKVWKNFWPVATTDSKEIKSLTRKCYVMVGLQLGCFIPAIGSNIVISLLPVLNKDLILKSAYPFQWNETGVYESIYIWQYVTQWYLLILVNGFDFFVIGLLAACITQFSILQHVCRNMLTNKSKNQKMILFDKNISDDFMLLKCLEQQKMLIKICQQLEDIFKIAMVWQFFVSTAALCSSCVVLKINSQEFSKMFTYAVAHMFQLFYYCYAGSELISQSEEVSNALYECPWHLTDNIQLQKALILMIQRSQTPQSLTAAGITELDLVNYIKVLRLSFSFYTLLSNLIDRKNAS